MFNFSRLEIGDQIFIPHNGVDEKGIVYLVIDGRAGALGGLISFVQLRKISTGGGFDEAELVYTANEATLLYGDGKDYTKVTSCTEQKMVTSSGIEMYQIEIGSWERNINFQVRPKYL